MLSITIELNHKSIAKILQIRKEYQNLFLLLIKIIRPFGLDWRKFESKNERITINILFIPYNSKEIRHAYISKHNS